jgi:hypothetical protein
MPVVDGKKKCGGCKQIKETSEFTVDSGASCGFKSYCRRCATKVVLKTIDRTYRLRRWVTIMSSARKRAKKSGMDFDLDAHKSEISERVSAGFCELTGLPFNFSKEGYNKQNPFGPSIDRIDCEIGYVYSNIRIVLICVNRALGEWGLDVFLPVAEALVAKNKF